MRFREDGSIQSSNVPTVQNNPRQIDNNIYRAIVIKTKFTDEIENITRNSRNPKVLYDVAILGGYKTGSIVSNCRVSPIIGGVGNYYERVLKQCSSPISEVGLADQDGDIVYVQFIQGHTTFPLIVGFEDAVDTQSFGFSGSKVEDGYQYRSYFNNVYENIDKMGSKTEIIGVTEDNLDDFFYKKKISPFEKKVTESFGTGLSITTDVEKDIIVIDLATGGQVLINGEASLITMRVGATTIEINGESGKISLQGDFIDLGASPVDMVTKYIELATAFMSHTHIAPQAPSGALSTTPPIAPLPISVGSQTVKVQD